MLENSCLMCDVKMNVRQRNHRYHGDTSDATTSSSFILLLPLPYSWFKNNMGWTNGWMNKQTDGWMERLTDRQTDGRDPPNYRPPLILQPELASDFRKNLKPCIKIK